MRPLRDIPIRQKLLVVLMATTAIALLLSGVGMILLDSILFRAEMQRNVSALANIVGNSSTAALAFNDPRAAAETLAMLKEKPHLAVGCIYRLDGSVMAQYTRPGEENRQCPPPLAENSMLFTRGDLVASRPILLDGRRLGTLVIRYDLGEFSERIRIYGAIVLLILLVSSLAAVFISSGLRALIAAPMVHLARVATSVSQTGNYAVRAEKETGDELGVLVDSFNAMLAGIQARDLEVQNARTLLETTLSSIGDAVISTDAGGVVFANPVAHSLLRVSQSGIVGKPINQVFRIVDEFSRTPLENPVDRVLREGTTTGLENHTILIAADGTSIPIDDTAAPIRLAGQTRGVVLVFRDITERQRAQQDAAYLAAIVESSDDAIIGKSPTGIIQSWNAGAGRLYGYQAEEVVGHPMSELVPADRQHEETNILEKVGAGGRVVHFETVRFRKDGGPVDVSLTISPIHNRAGDTVGISHVARDVTEQKRSAERLRQSQKLESLGILAGGIAHDFNNILTGILGHASLLSDALPRGTDEWSSAQQIAGAAERAAKLTQQMLAYSGKGRFVVEPVDVSRYIREIAALMNASIPKHVELNLQLAQGLPPVEADAAQLQQLVMNLLLNGAEAIPSEGGRLTVVTKVESLDRQQIRSLRGAEDLAPGRYVVIEVQDTGCGMDEETLPRIFDPFFTTKFTGRGLGLSAVQGIVRGHKGAIKVYSAPGVGTTFRVWLPAAAAGARAAAPVEPPPLPAARASGRILVVDDEEIVRKTAKAALERLGYDVVLACDGQEAVHVFRVIAPSVSLVLLDMTMPGIGGEETMRLLREVRPDIPIVLSTGFSEAEALRRFGNQNLAGFLQKPYSVRTLAEKMRLISTRILKRGGTV
jgi:PAS domain S-box-containing protein